MWYLFFLDICQKLAADVKQREWLVACCTHKVRVFFKSGNSHQFSTSKKESYGKQKRQQFSEESNRGLSLIHDCPLELLANSPLPFALSRAPMGSPFHITPTSIRGVSSFLFMNMIVSKRYIHAHWVSMCNMCCTQMTCTCSTLYFQALVLLLSASDVMVLHCSLYALIGLAQR